MRLKFWKKKTKCVNLQMLDAMQILTETLDKMKNQGVHPVAMYLSLEAAVKLHRTALINLGLMDEAHIDDLKNMMLARVNDVLDEEKKKPSGKEAYVS